MRFSRVSLADFQTGDFRAMEEQYLLRWHCHESTLSKNLPALLESNILTDCTIAAGNKTYRAHRLILAACSSYFLDIFQNISPLESSIVILHDVNPDDIEAILSYIYRGQCLVSKTQISRLVHLATTLKIQGLCNIKVQDGVRPHAEDEVDFANDECELETAGSAKIAPELDRQADTSRSCKETTEFRLDGIKREVSSTPSNEVGVVKKTLKDAPEICKCFICGKYLSNQYNLRVHMETHKDTYYSCLSCPHVSKSRDALRKHVSYRHPDEYTSRKRKKNG